jgi:hypothetical protein
MNLLILLIGNAEKIIKSNKLDANNFEIIKLDEKLLAKPRKVLRQMKSKKFENVYFGTIHLDFQRFQTFIKIYLFLSGFWRGAILDEESRQNKFTLSKFLFKEIPLFLLEIIWSGILVIIYHIKVFYLKWKYQAN